MTAPFQRSLFDAPAAGFDRAFTRLERTLLDATSWIDLQPGWVAGADRLFEDVLAARDWGQRERWMYERKVREPRLTAPWLEASGQPLRPALLEELRRALGERYGRHFDSVGFNLYRDGRDSVAWHRDHISQDVPNPTIALVSLGERRKFLLRPRGGGRSRTLLLGRGDLLVTGGTTHEQWEHAVPKVAQAGPRISLAFRHGLDPKAYAHKRRVEPDR